MSQTQYASQTAQSVPSQAGSSSPAAPPASWRKIAFVLALPVVAWILAFPIVTSSWFEHNCDSEWVRASNQIYTAHSVPCDIVIYGDSTAITGIDPDIIQARTHLRTCNIAQTKGALVVLGSRALDTYLSHNPRPRILLFQFSGADYYQPQSWSDTTSYMEGAIALLRYYPAADFVRALIAHPELFLGVMHYAYITGPEQYLSNRHRPEPKQTLLNVHFVRKGPAFSSCLLPVDIDPIFHKPDPNFIKQLRDRYGPMADRVLLDAAPQSNCDRHFDYLAKNLTGLDKEIEQYPFNLYNEGFTHYTNQGATQLSNEIAAQIDALNTTSQQAAARPPAHTPMESR